MFVLDTGANVTVNAVDIAAVKYIKRQPVLLGCSNQFALDVLRLPVGVGRHLDRTYQGSTPGNRLS